MIQHSKLIVEEILTIFLLLKKLIIKWAKHLFKSNEFFKYKIRIMKYGWLFFVDYQHEYFSFKQRTVVFVIEHLYKYKKKTPESYILKPINL